MTLYSNAPKNYQCPFCLLRDGVENTHTLSKQTDIVYQTDRVMAFVASHQWVRNIPNILIIPKTHFENVYELPVDYGNDIQLAIKIISFALKEGFHCNGVSTRQHNEPAGSQEVWHFHTHLTPRFKKDRFYIRHSMFRRFMAEDKRAIYADKLRRGVEKEIARNKS